MKSMLRFVEHAAPQVWTFRRKLLPNLLPLLCGLPFLGAALFLSARGRGLDPGLIAAALVVPTVSLNWLGLTGNREMRSLLAARLKPPGGATFVGFASSGYVGVLDPHEDLGFLMLEPNALTIVGERLSISIPRVGIKASYAFNPHALLGLGRWLVLESATSERTSRILVEPRQMGSLAANRRFGATLKAKIEAWSRT